MAAERCTGGISLSISAGPGESGAAAITSDGKKAQAGADIRFGVDENKFYPAFNNIFDCFLF